MMSSQKVLFLAGLILCGSESSMVITEDGAARSFDGKCHGEDAGFCLLSLRSTTRRVLVQNDAEHQGHSLLGVDQKMASRQLGMTSLEKVILAQTQRKKSEVVLATQTDRSGKLKTWLATQEKMNQKLKQGQDDFSQFLKVARSGQGACHARLLHAKRALDGLTREVEELTRVISANEENLAAETESLRVGTMNLQSLEHRKDTALQACDDAQAAAKDRYDQLGDELLELQQMSLDPALPRDVVIDGDNHLPHWSAAKGHHQFCAGEQLVCQDHGCRMKTPGECREACESAPECGGYTVYDHPDAPYKCLLFASCSEVLDSQYDQAHGTVTAFEKGPACNEAFDPQNTEAYRGCRGRTSQGTPCIPWTSTYQYDNYYDTDLDGAYCRNPDNLHDGLWCYTAGNTPDEDYAYYTCGDPRFDWQVPPETEPPTKPAIQPTQPAATQPATQQVVVVTQPATQPEVAIQPTQPAATQPATQQAVVVTEPETQPEVAIQPTQPAATEPATQQAVVVTEPETQPEVAIQHTQPAATQPATQQAVVVTEPATQGALLQLATSHKEPVEKRSLVLDTDKQCKAFVDYQRKLLGKRTAKKEQNLSFLQWSKVGELPPVEAVVQATAPANLPTGPVIIDPTQVAVVQPAPQTAAPTEAPTLREAGIEFNPATNPPSCDSPGANCDACGCMPGSGWSRAAEACVPAEQSDDDAGKLSCCSEAMLPKLSADGTRQPECVAIECEDLTEHAACNAKFGCGWSGDPNAPADGDACVVKETCCDYFQLAEQVITQAAVLATKPTEDEAMALCDGRTACTGVQENEDGSFSLMDSALEAYTTAAQGTKSFFPKGHCRRKVGGTCVRAKGGVPLDSDACQAQQAELQQMYTEAVDGVMDERDNERENMSHEELERCRQQEIDNYAGPLAQLASAVAQSVEVCEQASETIQLIAPTLTNLQADLHDMEKPDGLIYTLGVECSNAEAVSGYLQDVRDAIMNLANCPGNMAIQTSHAALHAVEPER